jgi:uncharacterized protein
MKMMPQEIEVWYLMPAIRKELSVSMHDMGMKQKRIAQILGLTPSAISQYIKDKRGNQALKEEFKIIINDAALQLSEGKPLIPIMKKLSEEARKMGILCELHKKYDPNIPRRCKLC